MFDVWWKLGGVMMTKNGELIQRHFEKLQSLLELYKSKKVTGTVENIKAVIDCS